MNKGKIIQIIGPVVDVEFPEEKLPSIYNALKIEREDETDLILEVEQHLGENRVRSVSMDSTDGLKRGTVVFDTGAPISMPVGEKTLGRLMNVTGDTIDDKGELKTEERYPIHRDDPEFTSWIFATKFTKPVSKFSTSFVPIQRVEKPDFSAVQVLAKPF